MTIGSAEVSEAARESLRNYRGNHRIVRYTDLDREQRCLTDDIRVLPVRGGRYRHHPDDLLRLMEHANGVGTWDRKEQADAVAVEVARDMIREDFRAGETIAIPWNRHVVDVEWSDD